MQSSKVYDHEAFLFDQAAKRAEELRVQGRTSSSPAFWRSKAKAMRTAADKARVREST